MTASSRLCRMTSEVTDAVDSKSSVCPLTVDANYSLYDPGQLGFFSFFLPICQKSRFYLPSA